MVGAVRLRGGQRPVEHVEQVVVLPEADGEGDREHDAADDQPTSQLVEVIDDAQSILVPDRAPHYLGHVCAPAGRQELRSEPTSADSRSGATPGAECSPGADAAPPAAGCSGTLALWGSAWRCGCSSSSSSSLESPVIESLNSRSPVPSCLPKPGSRLGPKISSTIKARPEDRWWDCGTFLRPPGGV